MQKSTVSILQERVLTMKNAGFGNLQKVSTCIPILILMNGAIEQQQQLGK
jgi:hypothetical protein